MLANRILKMGGKKFLRRDCARRLEASAPVPSNTSVALVTASTPLASVGKKGACLTLNRR